MKKFNRIVSLMSLLLALSSCSEGELPCDCADGGAMLFGVEQNIESRVEYNDKGDAGVSATFTDGDQIGLYAFYNNFYHYYNEYGSFAESVILPNIGAHINESQEVEYSPLRSWTFSTVYGTAPHTIDCAAYYKLKEGFNANYVHMTTIDDVPTLVYYYYSKSTVSVEDPDGTTSEVEQIQINSDIDFMTAHTRYDYSDSGAATFRAEMLKLPCIPLRFKRHTASMNLHVTKPNGYGSDIVVSKLEVLFNANTKFTHSIDSKSSVVWSEKVDSLTTYTTCNATLAETGTVGVPGEGVTIEVANLLEDDEVLFFPPGAEILRVIFTITCSDGERSYTWHPHAPTFEANTNYTLNLELDPDRSN